MFNTQWFRYGDRGSDDGRPIPFRERLIGIFVNRRTNYIASQEFYVHDGRMHEWTATGDHRTDPLLLDDLVLICWSHFPMDDVRSLL